MSRKWERMVLRNQKQINKQRKKQGKTAVGSTKPEGTYYYGRSIGLPVFLWAIGLFSAIAFAGQSDTMYYFTVIAYLLLGLFYFMKRPYLMIGKKYISTRRLGRDKPIAYENIQKITASDGHLMIEFKTQRTKWFFARFMNRFPVNEMTEALRSVAAQHQVPFVDERKGSVK